jgi:phosphatidylglycerophosphate synthase
MMRNAAYRPSQHSALRGGAITAVAVGASVIVAGTALYASGAGLAVAAAGYVIVAAIMLCGLVYSGIAAPFGAANTITLGRAGMIMIVAGFAVDTVSYGAGAWWIAASLAACAFLLDGVDGWAARRGGRCTGFGARFDMEVDAVFALVIAAVLWQAGKVGAWVMLIGALRYVFILASVLYPPMLRPLPPSNRRRAVCAFQGGALCIALAPFVSTGAAMGLAGAALLATAASFAIDTVWLLRQQNETPPR